MSIQIKNTNDVATDGCNIMVYSPAGWGKTTLIQTLPSPIILSAESGLLSIKGTNLDYIIINSMEDLKEAYSYIVSKEGDKYESVAIDSVSEIAEVVLIDQKKKYNNDGRKAYPGMADEVFSLIRAFRDLPSKHCYMTCKAAKEKDEMGTMLYSPTIPGAKAAQNIPYFYDFLLPLRVWKDEETGKVQRMLQTQPDGVWDAKARDNCKALNDWEEPDLGAIIRKVKGEAQ